MRVQRYTYRCERSNWEKTDHTTLKNVLYSVATFCAALLLAIIAIEIGEI